VDNFERILDAAGSRKQGGNFAAVGVYRSARLQLQVVITFLEQPEITVPSGNTVIRHSNCLAALKKHASRCAKIEAAYDCC
jgi:hypothetical protein